MYGRDAVLPVELQMTEQTLSYSAITCCTYIKMKHEKFFSVVDLNIKKAQKIQNDTFLLPM